ncbi:MAG: winged helix-turn-helix domain-containing protein [Candidatus Geothermarchaeales archaeon]
MEIVLSILEALHSHDDLNISQLMRLSNLSHRRLKGRIQEMVDSGLVQSHNSSEGTFYSLTGSGRMVLKKTRQLVSSLSSLGLFRNSVEMPVPQT